VRAVRRLAAIPLVALACGGSLTAVDRVEPAFTGTWVGPATLAVATGASDARDVRLSLVAAEDSLVVTSFCAPGVGALPATGGGLLATWGGALPCPPIAAAGCDALAVTWRRATFRLETGGALVIAAEGDATGCGATSAATLAARLNRS
jgi:hypothetical protein